MKRPTFFARALLLLGVVASLPVQAKAAGPETMAGRTERISLGIGGADAAGDSWAPAVSADGNVVVFLSSAWNLVPGDGNEAADVFAYDRRSRQMQLVSVSSTGAQTPRNFGIYDLPLGGPSVSADGRYVAFASHAPNLVEGDTNCPSLQPYNQWCGADVFVRDLWLQKTERVSLRSDGGQLDNYSLEPSISSDGRFVVYKSVATNLGYTSPCGAAACGGDIYIFDRVTRETELVSVSTDGNLGDDESSWPNVSSSGRYVAFGSYARNLTPDMPSNPREMFLRDRQTGTTSIVSTNDAGDIANEETWFIGTPHVSDDGSVVFTSAASNLVPTDANNIQYVTNNGGLTGDVFLRSGGRTRRISVGSGGAEAHGAGSESYAQAASADGRTIVFASMGRNITENDRGKNFSTVDLYRHDPVTGITELISRNSMGEQANHLSWEVAVSRDGSTAAFTSYASNLDPSPDAAPSEAGDQDVFVRALRPHSGLTGVNASRSGTSVTVTGDAWFDSSTVTARSDPSGDGMDEVGAEILEASVTYRPATKDLRVVLSLNSLPSFAPPTIARKPIRRPTPGYNLDPLRPSSGSVPSVAGVPGLVYGAKLAFDQGFGSPSQIEVRGVLEPNAVEPCSAGSCDWDTHPAHSFELFQCVSRCSVRGLEIEGGFGTTGSRITFSIPLLGALPLEAREGLSVLDASAYVGAGTLATGAATVLDEVTLANGSIPRRRVEAMVTPVGSTPDSWAAATKADLADGRFRARVQASQDESVWMRACTGSTCSDPARVA